jgi:hypothetical protein
MANQQSMNDQLRVRRQKMQSEDFKCIYKKTSII